MQPPILEQVRASLLGKRDALSHWLAGTPAPTRAIRLGPTDEAEVRQHIHTIDDYVARADDGTLGVCTVCHELVGTKRLMVDYTAAVCLDHLSGEEAAHLERELELAQVVQQALLPSEPPDLPGLQIAAFTRPAQIIGGDYFDFVGYQGGEVGWVVADVAGHGVSAGLQMAGLQALCRAVIPTSTSPAAAADQIQRLLVRNSRYTSFVTLFLATYDDSSREFVYCNAGHNPPLLLQDTAARKPRARWLQPTGPAIGLVEDGAYRQERLTLQPGDLLLIYTDGVVEATNADGLGFGADRLAEIVSSVGRAPAGDIVHTVTLALEDFLAGQDPADDVTLVASRVI